MPIRTPPECFFAHLLSGERVPGPGECASRDSVHDDQFAINTRGCVAQDLLYILFFEERVLSHQSSSVVIGGEEFEHAPYSDSHASNARLSAALSGFDCNAIELPHCRHFISL